MSANTFRTYVVAAALLCGLGTPAFAATSVSQYGITWTFSADRPTGQFVNGDWWVVGPVTITNITPRDTKADGITMHGSMLNPPAGIFGQQGFDSRLYLHSNGGVPYSDSLNVARAFPFSVPAGSSLLSSASFDPDRPAGVNDHYPYIKTVAILTVLASAPAPGSFRPPYVGTNKTINPNWNVSKINYGKLNRVAPLSTTPALSTVLQYAVEPQIEFVLGWQGRYVHPADNYLPARYPGSSSPTYGQAIANTYGAMLLAANMNYTNEQKAPLVIRLIQIGIDIYGAAINAPAPANGVIWTHGGGHNGGRKMPMLFAGVLLNDTSMIARANHASYKTFQEDSQFFYVSASDVSIFHTACCDRAVEQYTSSDIGMPEWGQNHIPEPQEDSRLWGAFYRNIASSSTMPHVLAAKLMAVESLWNQPAIFDYFEQRYYPLAKQYAGSGNEMEVYVRDLWAAYQNAPPPSGAPVSAPSSSGLPEAPVNLRIQ